MNTLQNKLNKIENKILNSKELDIDLIQIRNELVFKRNKENINVRLTCNNKYYYANECYKFTKHILKNGFNHFNIEEIKKNGISFNKYSINIGFNQYGNDLKRFNNKNEMLGFVIGYNSANNI